MPITTVPQEELLMIKESKRTRHLNSANFKTSIFAILTAILSAISGFQLYKLIIDAMDDNMLETVFPFLKTINLASIEINTAQQTMALAVIMFLIPFWLLISFLVKRHALSNGDTVGTGLYWLMVLVGIIGILYGLGILQNLLALNFAQLAKINTDLKSIIIAVLSGLLSILGLWSIININMAERAPVEYDDDYEDQDKNYSREDKKGRRVRRNNHPEEYEEEVITDRDADVKAIETNDLSETKVMSPERYGYDKVEAKKPVTKKVTRIVKHPVTSAGAANVVPKNLEDVKEPKVVQIAPEVKEPRLSDTNIMEAITPEQINASEEIIEELPVVESTKDIEKEVEEVKTEYNEVVSDPHDPDNQPKNRIMEEGISTPVYTTDFMDHDDDENLVENETSVDSIDDYEVNSNSEVNEDIVEEDEEQEEIIAEPELELAERASEDSKIMENEIESPGTIKEEEIKVTRRYIEMPGEDKVIVVTREFDSAGRLLDEKTEVKNKKDLNL